MPVTRASLGWRRLMISSAESFPPASALQLDDDPPLVRGGDAAPRAHGGAVGLHAGILRDDRRDLPAGSRHRLEGGPLASRFWPGSFPCPRSE